MSKIFNDFLAITYFGASLFEIFIIVVSIIFSLFFRGLFASLILTRLKKFIKSTNNHIDDAVFASLHPPLKFFPIVLIFLFLTIYINLDGIHFLYLKKINQTIFSIFIFWFLHQSVSLIFQILKKFEKLVTKELLIWLTNSLKYLLIFLGIVAVLETWGIKVGPVLAGLGLFGVALALGAQDMFKNLISGILILLERSFSIGDVVKLESHGEGTVEHIGFRSTKIRKFDSSLISIPNYIFAETPIINFSRRPFRRITWNIGLEYKSPLSQIKKFTEEIESFIQSNSLFKVSEEFPCFVRLDKFNDSSIDILIYCFTNTSSWDEYLNIKEKLAYEIKLKVEEMKLDFAFPSRSIYVESNQDNLNVKI